MKTIKKLLFVIFMTTAIQGLAQPSDSQIKSKVLSTGAKTVSFYGTGKVHNTLTETYYIRSLEATFSTDYPGVTRRTSYEYKYVKTGGSWNFDRTFTVQSLYDGIDNPTEDEILAIINTDMPKFLGGSYYDIVGDVESIKLAEEPHWLWHTVKSVEMDLETVYSKKMSSTEVSKVKQVYSVRLYADDFKQPWNKFISSKKGYPEILSTKTYTAEEIRNMKTMQDIDLDRQAEALMANLPKVDIPNFTNTKEVIVHTYNMMRTATYGEMKAYLYQMLGDSYFNKPGSKVLNSTGERLFEELEPMFASSHTKFESQYCEHPKVKYETETSMELWNRASDRYTRINVKEQGGKYIISSLKPYVHLKSEEANRVIGMQNSNCGEAISTEVAKKITYEVGETCKVYVRGYGWIAGTIKQKDTNFDNRYLVEDANGKSVWRTTEELDKSEQSDTPVVNQSSDSNNTTTNDSNTSNDSNSDENANTNGNKSDQQQNGSDSKDKKSKVNVNNAKNKVNGLKNKKIKIGG